MDFIPAVAALSPFMEEIVLVVATIGSIVTSLFVKDKKRKNQLLEIINDVKEGNDVLQKLAKKKNLLGAVKEIGKLLK